VFSAEITSLVPSAPNPACGSFVVDTVASVIGVLDV
jgi:hypothetical protein